MPSRTSRLAWWLSLVVLALLAAQSAAGLLLPHLYRDEAWALAAWRGNDLVSLLVAAPALGLGLWRARAGRWRGALLWYGMLDYSLYNAGFYLFGAKLNAMFPLYVALFVLPVFALVLALAGGSPVGLVQDGASRRGDHVVAVWLFISGLGLGSAWLAQWFAAVFRGRSPAIGEDAFAVVAAMDLSFVVPWTLTGAALLWLRRPWGHLLATVMSLKATTYTLVLTAGSLVSAARGVEGAAAQIPLWGAWSLASLLAAAALLVPARQESKP